MNEKEFNITPENFIQFVLKTYKNPNCTSFKEFQKDLNHIVYIKRMLCRIERNGNKITAQQRRLIINHIIILQNFFGVNNTVKILFFKCKEKHHSILKHFLLHLEYISSDEKIFGINNKVIDINEIITLEEHRQ